MGDVQLGPVTHLSPAEVQALWVNNGGDPAKALTAAAIVFSSENPAGNAGLVNATSETGDYSVGLWQINYLGALNATRSAEFGTAEQLAASPDAQARATIAMSQNGTNWQPWGPDFGYPDYSQPVPGPLAGSKVGNWLASHGGSAPSSGLPAGHLALLSVGIFGLAGAVAWAIHEGVFDDVRLPSLPRFGFLRENPAALERDPPPMWVQSLLFPLDRYNVPTAKRWAKHHDYLASHVELTDQYIHLVQMPPGKLTVIRTIDFGRGIKAHVGREASA